MDPTPSREDVSQAKPEAPASPDADAPKSRKRRRLRWWQKLFLICFSLVPLVLLELALRLVGYGPVVDFVVPRLDRGDERIMGINPEAYKRFHGRLQLDRGGRLAPWREFLDPKPEDTFRVMFMGGSTVEGYPHPPIGAAPAFLEALLQDAWPDKRVEVINCGVTAINSWSIRVWAKEVLACQPDMLVIYAGHNEFYGGFGPASLNAAGTNRTRVLAEIWLRDLRISRAISDLIAAVAPANTAPRGLLMEQLARERAIALDSDVYRGCRDNFRTNLEDIARYAADAGVPLVLCGLVSNEKDLVPMNSLHREDLSTDERENWEAHYQAGRAAGDAHRWQRALEAYAEAALIDDTHAELIYRMGEANERLGSHEEARGLYRRARDLDALRFRATAEFSEVIREVAQRHGARYVDVLPAFASASPHGLIGWNLMTDHLHPTLRGNYLIARAICETLADDEGGPFPAIDVMMLPEFAPVADRLGNDIMTEMLSKINIYQLTKAFPYANTPNATLHERIEKEILAWQASLTGPMAVGHHNWSNASTKDALQYHLGRAYRDAGNLRQAIDYFRKAERLSDPHSLPAARAKCALAEALLSAATTPEAKQEARAYADELRQWLQDAGAIHPEEQALFTQLEQELNEALAEIPG